MRLPSLYMTLRIVTTPRADQYLFIVSQLKNVLMNMSDPLPLVFDAVLLRNYRKLCTPRLESLKIIVDSDLNHCALVISLQQPILPR